MAWNFNGSNAYLTAAAAPVTGAPLTIACWFRKTGSPSVLQEVVALLNAATSQGFSLLAGNTSTSGAVAYAQGSTGALIGTSTVLTVGQWHHCAAVFVSSNLRHVFLDGGGKGTDTTSVSPAGVNRTDIGHGLFSYFQGDVAEAAVWDTALSDEEITVLAKGFSPLCLLNRLSNLVLYQDLIRPLNRLGIGPSLAAAGGTAVAPHPRVIYPWSRSVETILRQVQFLDFYRVSSAQAHANSVRQGLAAVSGPILGSSYPIGEVSN